MSWYGFLEIYPPAVVREQVMIGSGQLPKFYDNLYHDAEEDLWLVPQTGLVLRWDRTEDVEGNGFFTAHVQYHERATFVLESLTPST